MLEQTKLAILADIHGNAWALDAVLTDLDQRQVDAIVNLGDTLLGPLDPQRTYDLLQNRDMIHISGNQDRILWESLEDHTLSTHAPSILKEITPKQISWLQSLPATNIWRDSILLCHGTPFSDETYLVEEIREDGSVGTRSSEELESSLASIHYSVLLCGHSHIPRTVMLPSGKLIVNPGSVGLPAYTDESPVPHAMESCSPHAKYAILTHQARGWSVEHIEVPYDWDRAARAASQHGRDDWAKWLKTGRV